MNNNGIANRRRARARERDREEKSTNRVREVLGRVCKKEKKGSRDSVLFFNGKMFEMWWKCASTRESAEREQKTPTTPQRVTKRGKRVGTRKKNRTQPKKSMCHEFHSIFFHVCLAFRRIEATQLHSMRLCFRSVYTKKPQYSISSHTCIEWALFCFSSVFGSIVWA